MATTPQTVPAGHPGALDRTGVQTEIANQIETAGAIANAIEAAVASVSIGMSLRMDGELTGSEEEHVYNVQSTGETSTLFGLRYDLHSGNASGEIDLDVLLNDIAQTELTGLACALGGDIDLTTPIALTDGDKITAAINSATGVGDAVITAKVLKTSAISAT